MEIPESDYLFTSESQIPNAGLGLFTSIKIYKSEIIAFFKGKKITTKLAKELVKNKKHHYFILMPDGSILDSSNSKCFAKFANDTKGVSKTKFKNNAKITLDDQNKICLVAKRTIKPMEEIFCSYGKNYWSDKL